jgi:ribulose-phosphate 3-epimerase
VETCPHLHRTLHQIRELGCKAGISLNPSTPVSSIEEVLDDLDLILVMSVNPGFGGQSFIPGSVEKIRKLKRMIGHRPIELEVDGGISPANAQAVINAGATVLVAGSAIFNASSWPAMIQALKTGESMPSSMSALGC